MISTLILVLASIIASSPVDVPDSRVYFRLPTMTLSDQGGCDGVKPMYEDSVSCALMWRALPSYLLLGVSSVRGAKGEMVSAPMPMFPGTYRLYLQTNGPGGHGCVITSEVTVPDHTHPPPPEITDLEVHEP